MGLHAIHRESDAVCHPTSEHLNYAMATPQYVTLDSDDMLEQAFEHSMLEPVMLYKHSNLCGASFRARRQVTQLNDESSLPVYEVVVQNARPLSQQIESRLGVRHQTPQVIVLFRRQPVFTASHSRVTAQAVRQAIENITAS